MNEVKIIKTAILGVFVLFLILVGFSSYYTIDQGERGVILRNGAIVGIAEPGLGFKIPIISKVVKISVQDQAVVYNDVQAYSNDQQTAVMRVSLSYQVQTGNVSKLYSDYGSIDNLISRLLDRQVYKSMEEVFGQFNAATAIQDRVRLGKEFQSVIQKAVENSPITIKSVSIENIDFSSAYEQSIEDRMKAEVGVKTAQQNAQKAQVEAERDAKVTVINAEAAAKAKLAAAEADAKAVELRGNAEAAAIKAKGDALNSNPGLVALTQAEKWNGQLPSTMLPNSTVPFMSVGK
jgi:regulator of protease activity HflC (stomatin/prohibitin superfamily)